MTGEEAVDAAAIERVEAAMARLEERDQITPQDLETFRQSLPTDSQTADIVEKAVLKWPLNHVFEYVSGSERQSAYWRVAPERQTPRSAREAEFREQFADAAQSAQGACGTMIYDDEEIPTSAARVAAELKDIEIKVEEQPDSSLSGVRATQRLQDVLRSEPSEATETETRQ